MSKNAPFCNVKEGEKTFLDMTPKGWWGAFWAETILPTKKSTKKNKLDVWGYYGFQTKYVCPTCDTLLG